MAIPAKLLMNDALVAVLALMANPIVVGGTLCGPSTVSGSASVQGPTGSKGTDNVTCPAGTIECTSLNQYLPQLNLLRPSGSQFIKVCMQIPPGCTSENAVCPDYLPSGSVSSTYPSIP